VTLIIPEFFTAVVLERSSVPLEKPERIAVAPADTFNVSAAALKSVIVSLPNAMLIISAPPPLVMLSLLDVPVIVSAPAEPVIVCAAVDVAAVITNP